MSPSCTTLWLSRQPLNDLSAWETYLPRAELSRVTRLVCPLTSVSGEGRRCTQEDDGGEAPPRLSTMWRAAHMDLVKFMVSATSENKLYSEAWRSGSKLLREYGLMMRKEHHVDVRLFPFSHVAHQSAHLARLGIQEGAAVCIPIG